MPAPASTVADLTEGGHLAPIDATDPDEGQQGLPPILTAPEAAAYLRVSLPTIYQAIRQGDLVSFRVGRAIRLSRIAVLNFINGPQGHE